MKQTEINLVQVHGDLWMTEEDAYRRGYRPVIDKPIKGASFFHPDAFWNILTVGLTIYVIYLITPVVYDFVGKVLISAGLK